MTDENQTKTAKTDNKEENKKYVSEADEFSRMIQTRLMEGMKSGDTTMGKAMETTMSMMMNYMMMMNLPKMVKQLGGSDDGDSKFDMVIQQIKDEAKAREDRLMEEIRALKEEKKTKELVSEIVEQVDKKIDPIAETVSNLKKEQDKEPDKNTVDLMNKIDSLQKQFTEMTDSTKAEAYAPITKELNELRRRLDDLNTSRTRGDSIDDLLEQMEKIEKTKSRLAQLFGVPSKQADEMSPTQLIDTITKKGPEIVNSAKSMYDMIRGKELVDDNPVPEIPEVAAPVRGPAIPELDPELKRFIEEGHEEYVDSSDPSKGKIWISKYGIPITSATNEPMSKEDVRKYALAYTDDFRRLKNEIEEYVKEQAQNTPPPVPEDTMPEPQIQNISPPVSEDKETEPQIQPEPLKQEESEKKPEETPKQKEKEIEVTDEMLNAAEHPVK
ncbi:MAG: hypothetical protein ACP5RE_03475 [Candidatus Acidifodinimicrobium sp.]